MDPVIEKLFAICEKAKTELKKEKDQWHVCYMGVTTLGMLYVIVKPFWGSQMRSCRVFIALESNIERIQEVKVEGVNHMMDGGTTHIITSLGRFVFPRKKAKKTHFAPLKGKKENLLEYTFLN